MRRAAPFVLLALALACAPGEDSSDGSGPDRAADSGRSAAPDGSAAASGSGTRASGDSAQATGMAGGGLAYEISGRSDGEPVALLHGFSLDRRMWEPQMGPLEDRFRVIRYDLRGHGHSVGFEESYSSHRDLLAVLDETGVERAVLVGLSLGSQIAIDFSIAHPDRVRGLVLGAPGLGGFTPTGSFEWVAPVYEAAREGDLDEAARRWAGTELMAIPERPAADSLMRTIVADNATIWLQEVNPEQPLSPPAMGRLGEIEVPILVIVGERDLPDMHAIADTLVSRAPSARKQVVPDAGHMVNLAAPEAFNRALLDFLAGEVR